jgi:hypothetical protein
MRLEAMRLEARGDEVKGERLKAGISPLFHRST